MKKIETIWHFILMDAITRRNYQFTQQALARQFGYSLSTVHHALRVPSQMGAVRKTGKAFVLQDFKKLLYYWASFRRFAGDLIYQTAVDAPVREIESLAVPSSLYGAYSAAKRIFGEPAADYSKVYFYLAPADLPRFERRFPPFSKHPPNTFALKMHPSLSQGPGGSWTSPVHTFVDLWNLTDWYARDFAQALEAKIDALLS